MAILFAIAVLSFIIIIHELGHYIVARATDLTPGSFGVFFGNPVIALTFSRGVIFDHGKSKWVYMLGFRFWHNKTLSYRSFDISDKNSLRVVLDAFAGIVGNGKTEWRIGWIPLGGYVKVEMSTGRPRFILDSMIYLAGPVMNIVFALLCFSLACLLNHGYDMIQMVQHATQTCSSILLSYADIFSGIFSTGYTPEVYGPVGIVAVVAESNQHDFEYLMILTGSISMAIAICNLIPIPPLDGGKLAFVCLRSITPKYGRYAEVVASMIGEIALLVFVIVVTTSDVVKFF